jgi:HTH-type transcriptional regulator/antitoxin HipB
MEVAVVVRARRKQRGWSQQELARRAGVGRDWIIRLEKAKPGVEFGLVMRTLRELGFAIRLEDAAVPTAPVIDLNEILNNTQS